MRGFFVRGVVGGYNGFVSLLDLEDNNGQAARKEGLSLFETEPEILLVATIDWECFLVQNDWKARQTRKKIMRG